MYKSILVPLDGSSRAERILSHIEELAQNVGAKLVLLRVVEPDLSSLGTVGAPAEFYIEGFKRSTEDAQKYLAALQGEFRAKGIQVRTVVERGPVANTIINVAAREDVDLIAMASHGRSGLRRVFYGSVAAGVLHHVDRPLLLIRADDLS